ncbi:hypothetical protein MLD38_016497 [Melastoma candidum]|uniref:Uncharacterized protein n=1 Tax=Melastoma candidum TaxID=119954 RepID=A0ACB9QMR2_9MYRT|nr:hypothetical protein MLD38_016497 [Melastoma candidum]
MKHSVHQIRNGIFKSEMLLPMPLSLLSAISLRVVQDLFLLFLEVPTDASALAGPPSGSADFLAEDLFRFLRLDSDNNSRECLVTGVPSLLSESPASDTGKPGSQI